MLSNAYLDVLGDIQGSISGHWDLQGLGSELRLGMTGSSGHERDVSFAKGF